MLAILGGYTGNVQKDSQKNVVIVGGGIVGLCSAYYAMQRGWQVVVLERDAEVGDSCSFGNAGMVVPSHFIPLAAPGMISKGMRWMMNPESPFYVKPRLSLDLVRWGIQFWKHANEKHTEQSKGLLAKMSLASRALFEDLQLEEDFGLEKRGLLMLCKTQKGLESDAEMAKMAVALGVKAEVCDARRIAELDPAIQMDIKGGVWFEQDCHLDPQRLMAMLRRRLVDGGAEIRYQSEVESFEKSGAKVKAVVLKNGGKVQADSVVVTGGSWTPSLTKKLGVNLLLQAGKGYSLTLSNPVELPKLCSIFSEAKVAATPIGNQLRFAGTMEIGGNELSVNSKRVRGIIKSVNNYFPQFDESHFDSVEPWAGLRPCSPDGIPYIGKLPNVENAVVATGHAMMGLSLGPITGKMVVDLLEGESLDRRLSVDRF